VRADLAPDAQLWPPASRVPGLFDLLPQPGSGNFNSNNNDQTSALASNVLDTVSRTVRSPQTRPSGKVDVAKRHQNVLGAEPGPYEDSDPGVPRGRLCGVSDQTPAWADMPASSPK
jgi:hypothetical protein